MVNYYYREFKSANITAWSSFELHLCPCSFQKVKNRTILPHHRVELKEH